MSAAAAPDPDERRDGHDPRPDAEACALSDRDLRILGDITVHESGADPEFVAALRGPRWRVGPLTQLALQILAVVAVALVVVPQYWTVIVFFGTVLVGAVVFTGWWRAASVWDPRATEQHRKS